MVKEDQWDVIIQPSSKWFDFNFKDVWKYKDLILMFVKRDFISQYKQTILGPVWFLIQPVITTLTYIIIFAGIADLSTDGLPPTLFYLSGILFWNYFSSTLLKISETFLSNTNIFGKIYFPRLVVPVSVVISSLLSFSLQFVLLLGTFIFFILFKGYSFNMQLTILLFPYIILLMALLAIGLGGLISSLTIKYRDLRYLVTFGIPLLMYATPVVYPISTIKNTTVAFLLKLNPMTGIIETFRHSFFGTGLFSWEALLYTSIITIALFFLGLSLFNKVEKNFMDSI